MSRECVRSEGPSPAAEMAPRALGARPLLRCCMRRLLLVLCAAAVACEPAPQGLEALSGAAIQGGLKDGTPVEAFLWLEPREQAALGRLENLDGSTRCTSSLIHERIVLTAAHCFALPQPADPLEVAVELGTVLFRTGEHTVPLAGLVRHPALDVAVAFLGEAVDDAAATPLPLAPATLDLEAGASVFVFGAGRGTPTDELLVGGEFVIERIDEAELVLEPAGEARLCGGDSGGPVLILGESAPLIVGVHVRGYPDCAPPNYSIRADRLQSWLADVLANPPEPLTTCDSTLAENVCVEGHARRCENGYWRSYPCSDVHYACEVSEEMVPCTPIPCEGISATGRCDEGIARVCLGGTLATFDCIAQGQGCELLVEEARVGCVACTACEGQCVDHATNSLHCGACGVECAPSGRGRCVDGECVRPASAEDTEEPPSPPATSGDTGDNFEPSLRLDCASCPLSPREFAMMSALALLPPVISSFRRWKRRRRTG